MDPSSLVAVGQASLSAQSSNVLIGFCISLLAAVFNGTYSVLAKEGFKPSDVDDTVFNLWACLGLSVSGLIVAAIKGPLVFEPLGLISGILLSTTIAWAFVTVSFLGASVGTGVKCGTESLMSFFFGLLIDPNGGPPRNLPLAFVGLSLLVGSIGGIAYAGRPAQQSGDEETGFLGTKEKRQKIWHFAVGLSFSVIAGVTGGLVLAPMQFVPEPHRGITFLPSLVTGVLIGSPSVAILPHLYRRERIELKPKTAAVPGIAAGLCWNTSNILKMIAIGYIGYGLAYPIVQTSLFVSGLWGILWFDEMKEKRNRVIFFVSGAVCIVGASLLTLAK